MRHAIVARKLIVLLSLGLLVGCIDSARDESVEPNNPYIGYSSALYDGPENWLCHPELTNDKNVCKKDIDATLVFADGTTQLEQVGEAENPEIDCFYIYPTVSWDPGLNSDLVPEEEIAPVWDQAARYRTVCAVYAPLYRQNTLTSLIDPTKPRNFDIAYGDVLDAFKQYIANANGRGYILVGHAQGSRHLVRLIQEEIETHTWLLEHMIAAHIPGHLIELPINAEVGATFQQTHPCTLVDDTNCFVNYTSYRESDPPMPETANYAITDSDETRAACTNPVQLGGGKLNMDSYFATQNFNAYHDSQRNKTINTPFFKLPGLIQGECIEQDGKGYLAISYDASASDPRVDDVGGDLFEGWGLHLIDFNLGMGDLVRLAESQSLSWLKEREQGD